jgi:tRNA pseudouridine55 synthase
VLLVDKPEGPTSHDVVDHVRRILRARRVGHTGTLDPMASGLLIILVGRATRLARFLVGLDKRYRGTIRLGASTTTDDRDGQVTSESDAWRALDQATVAAAMRALEGTHLQRPPAFSAKKVQGQRAHRAARRGSTPALVPAEVQVRQFTSTGRTGSELHFEAVVSSGTYVRALARDLGAALGCGAHLVSLRRTAVGAFDVRDAVSLEDLAADAGRLRPSREAVRHLPTVEADDAAVESLRHGRAISTPEGAEGPVAVLAGDDLVAIAERHGAHLRPRVVLIS